MAKREVRYYFGRLNVIAPRTDKAGLLTDGMQPQAIVSHRGLNWGFFQLNTIESSLGDFVHGFLVKFRPQTAEEIAIPETHEIDDRMIENRIKAKARFFLHLSSHIIAYRPFGREISRAVFANRFKELFEKNLGGFFVEAEIFPIDEERQIFDAIRSLQKISRVRVYLHPSNPSNREVWKNVDQRLRNLQVASYREEYDAERGSNGLAISEDSEINSKIAMAEDGYGSVHIVGEVDGERKAVSTRDAPVIGLAPYDDEPPEVVLESLAGTLRKILDRFTG
jgi:uncharacterized protein DUF4747